jgi:hypothetical protein
MEPTTPKQLDTSTALRGAGLVLLAITAALIWQEVSLDAVYLLLAGSAATTIAGFVLERRKTEAWGPLLSFASLIASAGWYAATREPVALAALGVTCLGFCALAWLHRARRAGLHRTLVFQGAVWSAMALSLALDFHLFHASELGDEGFVARRVILTIGWLLPGLGLIVEGGKREDQAFRGAGLVLTVAALGKLLTYDTIQLDGALRIAAYGLAGVLTLVAGTLATRRAPSAGSAR